MLFHRICSSYVQRGQSRVIYPSELSAITVSLPEPISQGTRIDWESYLLPAGYLDSLSFFGVGGQLRALRKPTYDLDSLRRAQSGDGVFKDQSFLVILEKPGKSKEDVRSFASTLLFPEGMEIDPRLGHHIVRLRLAET